MLSRTEHEFCFKPRDLLYFTESHSTFFFVFLTGWIVDKTGRLDLVFLVSGSAFLLGGISIVMSVRANDRLTTEDRH